MRETARHNELWPRLLRGISTRKACACWQAQQDREERMRKGTVLDKVTPPTRGRRTKSPGMSLMWL